MLLRFMAYFVAGLAVAITYPAWGQATPPQRAIDARYVGKITYEGQITGEETVTNRTTGRTRSRQYSEFTRVELEINADVITGFMTSRNFSLGIASLKGRRTGDRCELEREDGARWTGRCDASEFQANIVNPPDSRVSYRLIGNLSAKSMSGYTGVVASADQIAAEQAAAATVTAAVPGMKTAITAKVGVPLVARWAPERHPIFYDEAAASGPWFIETKYGAANAKELEWGSGMLRPAGSFLPIANYRAVSLFVPGGKDQKIGGLYVTQGAPGWPAALSKGIVIWAIDGYSFASTGRSDRQMAQYMARRPRTSYAYVEYFILAQEGSGGVNGYQIQPLRDRNGRPYSQAMIVPLTTEVVATAIGSGSVNDAAASEFARAVGLAIGAHVAGALVAELSRPVADRIREDIECSRIYEEDRDNPRNPCGI